jgi:hypothetical protein
MIHSVTAFTGHISQISWAGKAANLYKKISPLIRPVYNSSCAVMFTSQGAFELHKAARKKTACLSPSRFVEPKNYYPLHGGLLIASGVCSAFEGAYFFKAIDLGKLFKPLQVAGGVTFLLAMILELEKNIQHFEMLSAKASHADTEKEAASIKWEKRATFTGILSNIGYILATSLTLFGLATGFALFIGVISACFGLMSLIFDYLKG